MTSDAWDTMAGLMIQCNHRSAARDCVQRALQACDPADIKTRAPFWRKLISYSPDQQMTAVYAELQKWVSRQMRGNEMDDGRLKKSSLRAQLVFRAVRLAVMAG